MKNEEGRMKKVDDSIRCEFCTWFDKGGYCRRVKSSVHRLGICNLFKILLADHYVRNAWDEWKDQAERKARAEKAKSGG